MRIGAKKRPFYRVVIVDERSKRNGAYIENVGTYDPMTTPHEIKLKQDRIDHWLKQGAQKSDGFLRILGEAPQRPPRKAKKAAREEPKTPAAEAPKAETTPDVSETPVASETPEEVTAQEAPAGEQPQEVVESTEAQPDAETPAEAPKDEPTEVPAEPEVKEPSKE